jgi:tRNA1(Val) A37 N6-methylase TrmN6
LLAADIRDAAAAKDGPGPASADAVIMNPPFHDPGAGTQPSSAPRRAAYVLEDGLEPWFGAADSLMKPHGLVALIFRADRLDDVLAASRGRFGGISVLPVIPRANSVATRVIVSGRKGSRTPLRLLPPLILHGPSGNAYLPAVDTVLRQGVALSTVHPSWTGLG